MITTEFDINIPENGQPLFPQEATLAEIDAFIPHLPVYDCGDGRFAIPVDQKPLTDHFRKLGMFVFSLDAQEERHGIVIAPTPASLGYDQLPNSIGYRRQKAEPIAQFIFDKTKPLLEGRVSAISTNNQLVDLTDVDVVDLGPHLQSCIVNAMGFTQKWLNATILTK